MRHCSAARLARAAGLVAALAVGAVGAPANASLRILLDDLQNPRRLRDLDPLSGETIFAREAASCTAPGFEDVVFTVGSIGFIAALTHDGDRFWALDWAASGTPPSVRLAEIRISLSGCYEARNVAGTAATVGFFELQSLAWCESDETLYSVDFDAQGAPHRGQLIRISRTTGVGEAVAPGTFLLADRRVVGLACDDTGMLWAVTSGFASREPELLQIDPSTGIETAIGPTGTAASASSSWQIESLAVDLDGEVYGAGSGVWAFDENTGAASPVPGAAFETVFGFTRLVPEPGSTATGTLASICLAGLHRRRTRDRRRGLRS